MRTSRWQVVLAVLVVVVGLALAGSWARRGITGRCALDGAAVDRIYRVRVVDEEGPSHDFCCIRCAELWLAAREGSPRALYVTDEASGEEVEAGRAWYVRSSVVTRATTGNRVHAFRERQDAERHAATAGGRVLTGADRPFAAE